MATAPFKKNYLWIWFAWLLLFYCTWLVLVLSQSQWHVVVQHWQIAVAMALGSFAAGSTPMGGGTVGFPVLVLGFDMPAILGRDFSFAIQSIGMVSASIFIFARRQAVASAALKGAILGSLAGTPLGILFIAPMIPELWIKLVFAVIWASFGLHHLFRINQIAANTGLRSLGKSRDLRVGVLLGFMSSLSVVAVTGVGIDMFIYTFLVLLCRSDLKIAIPTSVVIMAFTSLLGVVIKLFTVGMVPGVYENWLAAAPIVALGAPLGVFFVSRIGRKSILLVVAILCIFQYLWTCFTEYKLLGAAGVGVSLLLIAALLVAFERLRWAGELRG
ncbi:MAG: sulfite exporter TauE/SafE family protein [Cellvibrionaceae bacterium]|nr:sulfite exporter TauE/SafE family protein [Cellvibrionaceae bacterium]